MATVTNTFVLKLQDQDFEKGLKEATELSKKANKEIADSLVRQANLNLKLSKQQSDLAKAKKTDSRKELADRRKNISSTKELIAAEASKQRGLKLAKTFQDQQSASLNKNTIAKKKNTTATSNLANQTIRYLRWAGTIAGVLYAVDRAWSVTLGKGIQVNRMMEDNVSGIGALLSANTQMVLTNGEVVNSYEKFKIGQEVAIKTMDDLRKASVKTYATFPQLTEIFQQAIGQTLSMGDAFGTTTKEITSNTIKLSQRMSNIAGAIGMPMDRAKEEIRSLLSGNASTDSLISTMIFGSPGEANKAIRMAKDRGEKGLTDMLDAILAPFDALENVDSYTKSLLLLEDAWSQLWATVSQPLTESMKSQYKHLAIAINFYKDSMVEAREEEEKALKSRRTTEIVRELESLINRQKRLSDLMSGKSTQNKGWARTFFEGEDSPEDIETNFKKVSSAIKDLINKYDKLYETAPEGELVTKPSFDTKFLEKAQKDLNKNKTKTLLIEEEITKANEQNLLYTDFIKANEHIIAKDKATQVILDGQINVAKNATSIFTALIAQDEEKIADIKLNAELRELRATQALLIAQGELLGVEVTKEEIIESNITLLEKELAGEKDITKQMILQTKIINEKLKLKDKGKSFFEGWDNTISKTFVDGIQDALDGNFDFSSIVGALSSSLGNALATQATTSMVKTIGTSDAVTGSMVGGLGLGVGMMAIGSIIDSQERIAEEKRIRDENLQNSIDGLKDATEKLYAQVYGEGTAIQQTITRGVSKELGGLASLEGAKSFIEDLDEATDSDLLSSLYKELVKEIDTDINTLKVSIKEYTSELVSSIDAIADFSDRFGDLSDELSGTTTQADIRGEQALADTYELLGISSEAEFQAKLDELVGITEFNNAEAIKEALAQEIGTSEYDWGLAQVEGLTDPVIDAINNYDTLATAVDYLNQLEQERIDNGEVILSLAEARNVIEADIIAQWTEADDRLNSLSDTFSTLGESIEDTITTLLGGSDALDAQDTLIAQFWSKQSELDALLAKGGDLTAEEEANLSDMIGDINQLSLEIQKSSIGDNSLITSELVAELGAIGVGLESSAQDVSVQDTILDLTQTAIDYLGADSEIVTWLETLNGTMEDIAFADYLSAIELQEAYDTVDGTHADGLSYVPFDGYRAELHQGERVLTKAENNMYPSSSMMQSYASQTNDPEIKNLLAQVVQRLDRIEVTSRSTSENIDDVVVGSRTFKTEAVS